MSEGLGVLLSYLSGNADSVAAFKGALGKTIAALRMEDDELRLDFTDQTAVAFADAGQSCCESRYMTCDDDLAPFVGARLIDAEVREAPARDCEYGEHECAFLVVMTSLGTFTCCTHNEHNGYYGGFALRCRAL